MGRLQARIVLWKGGRGRGGNGRRSRHAAYLCGGQEELLLLRCPRALGARAIRAAPLCCSICSSALMQQGIRPCAASMRGTLYVACSHCDHWSRRQRRHKHAKAPPPTARCASETCFRFWSVFCHHGACLRVVVSIPQRRAGVRQACRQLPRVHPAAGVTRIDAADFRAAFFNKEGPPQSWTSQRSNQAPLNSFPASTGATYT